MHQFDNSGIMTAEGRIMYAQRRTETFENMIRRANDENLTLPATHKGSGQVLDVLRRIAVELGATGGWDAIKDAPSGELPYPEEWYVSENGFTTYHAQITTNGRTLAGGYVFDSRDALVARFKHDDAEHLRTRDEIVELKRGWVEDPHYDLEDADGFEMHAEELLAFRRSMEDKWKADNEARERAVVEAKMLEIGIDDPRIAAVVISLERQIGELKERIDRVEQR